MYRMPQMAMQHGSQIELIFEMMSFVTLRTFSAPGDGSSGTHQEKRGTQTMANRQMYT